MVENIVPSNPRHVPHFYWRYIVTRPPGAFNIKESKRQAAVRLFKEGLGRSEIIKTLVEMGSTESTAVQYYAYAKYQTTKENIYNDQH
jgi:hypothetical protein